MIDEKNDLTQPVAKTIPNSSDQFAQQGYYQLQAAKLNSEAVIKAAKIGARARYFHGVSAMITAFGVFGAFAYKLYEENQQIRIQTEKMHTEIKNQEILLQELVQAYEQVAEQYRSAGKMKENEEFQKKAAATYEKKLHLST